LKLLVTSSAEEHLLSNKENDLLTLRKDLGYSPLFIASEKGRPDTLQFLSAVAQIFFVIDVEINRLLI